jgi:prophage regulatory protein
MKFLLRRDLKSRGIPFTNKHLLKLEREGRFPKRVKLGDQTSAWVEEEVDAYQQALAAARNETSSAA